MAERHYTGFFTKQAIATVVCSTLFAIAVSGCKDSQKSNTSPSPSGVPAQASPAPFSLDSILTGLEGAGSDVQDAVRPHADAVQAKTREEVDKLFQWEYKVMEVPFPGATSALQEQLARLGEENWEVIDMTTVGPVTRITSKRRPRSALGYLKYIPGF